MLRERVIIVDRIICTEKSVIISNKRLPDYNHYISELLRYVSCRECRNQPSGRFIFCSNLIFYGIVN